MYDVITIGSATKDVFLVSKKFKIIKDTQFSTGFGECLPLGSKIELDELIETTGGGATNAAATFASLGLNAATIARVANDASGRDVLEDLEHFGVNTKLVKKLKTGRTGYGALLTAANGERSVLVHRGVSATFTARDLPKKLNTKWLYVSSLGGNIALVQKITRLAKKNGISMAYNPGSLELKHGMKAFEPLLRSLTLLNLNVEEAQLLARSKSRDVKHLCEKICKNSDVTLIVTDGPKGAYAHQNGETWFARATGAKSLSRTGAGDAFGSGLVTTLIKKGTLEDALRVGTLNAESVIQKHGAKFGILTKWPTKKQLATIKVRKLTI